MREAVFVRCTRCESQPLVTVTFDGDEDESLRVRYNDDEIDVEDNPDLKAVYFRCRECDRPLVALKDHDEE